MIYKSTYGDAELVNKKSVKICGKTYLFYVFQVKDKMVLVREDKLADVGFVKAENN